MKLKKAFKIIIGIVIFITLPSLLLYGFAYFKYNEELPQGQTGIEADALATKMQNALNINAFNNTKYIEFTAFNRRHYEWEKSKDICKIYWKDFKVELNLKNLDSSSAYIHSFKVTGDQKGKLYKKAIKYFNKDMFWLTAPYKAFEKGVERRIVKTKNNTDALLITHPKEDNTPIKTYLWILDSYGKPTAFKMWDSSLLINGMEASWSDWITTKNGAQLPVFHKLFLFGIEFKNIIGTP
jgi:hypothetical protein